MPIKIKFNNAYFLKLQYFAVALYIYRKKVVIEKYSIYNNKCK